MKIALTKALGRTITVVSTLLIAISLLGILNLTFPEYANFVKELFGFDKETMTFFTLGTAGTGTIGLIGRTLKNSYNTQNAMLVSKHNAEIDKWKKEKELLEINQNEFMREFTIKQREQLENQNEIIKKQTLILDFEKAYAKERLKMSDSLVPQDVKKEYQEFLDRANSIDIDTKEIEPIFITEEVEKVVEVELTPQEVKEREKALKLDAKNDKRVGVR